MVATNELKNGQGYDPEMEFSEVLPQEIIEMLRAYFQISEPVLIDYFQRPADKKTPNLTALWSGTA